MTAPEDGFTPENWAARDSSTPLIGVRPRADVDLALKYLTVRSEAPAQFALGAAAAYRWAMGRAARAPVTGTDARRVPDLRLLTAEMDAAVVQLEDPTTEAGVRDFTRGVHDALAWVCGYSDGRI
ncbi:hypothetical protein [Streptomyces sp. NBC_00212]|uniref:hypothetical protein n=1 Tax=Streptomyces sp. NBC_00212 TaxID=2975684 RepID=UPI003255F87C